MIRKTFAFASGYSNRFLWLYYTDLSGFVPILSGRKSRFSKKYFHFLGFILYFYKKSIGFDPYGGLFMKKMLVLLLALTFALLCFSGCSERSLLNPKNPVTLTLWHTYGEQADSR